MGPICGPKFKIFADSEDVTTQNDRKRSRILMEMVLEVTLKTSRPFRALFGNFEVIWGHLLSGSPTHLLMELGWDYTVPLPFLMHFWAI